MGTIKSMMAFLYKKSCSVQFCFLKDLNQQEALPHLFLLGDSVCTFVKYKPPSHPLTVLLPYKPFFFFKSAHFTITLLYEFCLKEQIWEK